MIATSDGGDLDDLDESCVAELKSSYARLRMMTNRNKVFHHNPRRDKQWGTLAKKLLDAGIHPRRYMLWAFRWYIHERKLGVPMVDQIVSARIIGAYLEACPGDPEREVRDACVFQQQLLERELGFGRSLRDILTDPHLELGSVFRLAVARRANLADCAARFKEEAEIELEFEPAWERVLGEHLLIPE